MICCRGSFCLPPLAAIGGQQLAYASLSLKHARDMDLLVPVDCVEVALQVLAAAGYALSDVAPLN